LIEALELAEASGDLRGAAIVKGNLADMFVAEGDDERAAALLEEALEGHRALGDIYGAATSLVSLAVLARRHGDLDGAAVNLRESLELSHSIQNVLTLSWTLPIAAGLVLARGDPYAAACLCAADEELRRVHSFDLDQSERQELEDTLDAVRNALGPAFEEAWAAGANLGLDGTVDLALRALDASGTSNP
jgi:hypothetical protein